MPPNQPPTPNEPKHHEIEPQHHDVVIFPIPQAASSTQCYRFPINRESGSAGTVGSYTQSPKLRGISDEGQRKALSFMRPSHFDEKNDGNRRGPAFAVAAVKAEPSEVGFLTCFLINADYFRQPNHWTVEEWDDTPDGPDYPPKHHPAEIDVLMAAPWGEVLRLKLQMPAGGWKGWQETKIGKPGEEFGSISRVDLKEESEVYYQLRNGCIAGRSWFEAENKTIPLVNITALL